VYNQFADLNKYYDDPLVPNNVLAAKHAIPTYLCPSNPIRPSNGLDSAGYGYTDYGPTVYTDISPLTGCRDKRTRMDGALHAGGTTLGQISDGLSKTIAIAEDVGRNELTLSPYIDPEGVPAGSFRGFWRWAEPDCGYGVSGDPLATMDQTMGTPVAGFGPGAVAPQVINNNKAPFGGGACPWDRGVTVNTQFNNNCGYNDEIFSFHGNGANVLFMDGHVTFLPEKIDPVVMRYLVTASEQISPSTPTPFSSGYVGY
jgi:prepilin-type processing-associated H-X9-DG protein